MKALEGIRILDFGRVLSAPYATMILADMGADVVKIEHPEYGDDTRAFGPPFIRDVSSYFLSINRGKRSVTLNMKDHKDIEIIKELIGVSDVLVENFRPDVMTKFGLGYKDLQKNNPRLIYCSLSGFGSEYPEKPGYDLMMQGLSGIPSITGPEDGDPYKCGASIADLISGMNMVQGILAALYRRERTGQGGFVDVSMIDSMLSLLTYHASAWLNAGQEPKRRGNAHPSIHPFQPYPCKDGYLTVCVGNDRLFVSFAKSLGVPQIAEDARFCSNMLRVQHREALDEIITPILRNKTKKEWQEIFTQFDVPADIVATIPEALEQAKIVEHPHPDRQSTVRTLANGFTIDHNVMVHPRPAPKLGEHNQEVLEEWLHYAKK